VAWTYAEYSKLPGVTKNAVTIANWFLEKTNIVQKLPWQTEKQLSQDFLAMNTLPSITWRNLNEGYTESTGTLIPKTERIWTAIRFWQMQEVAWKP
jgi:hypothetical protein